MLTQSASVEAKSICVRKLEDLLLDPMFTIFHVQHAQIASKTETNNSLIYHLKCSMAKVRHWNSTTVRDFCANLVSRFPALGDSFPHLFRELQELTCKILNESSESSSYVPVSEETHTFLHSFISACSDAFIAHTHWFAVEESSTEFQSCKNNAKVRMQQANIVENTVMNFVKAGPKEVEDEHFLDDTSLHSAKSGHSQHSQHSQHSRSSRHSRNSRHSRHSRHSRQDIEDLEGFASDTSKQSDLPGKKSIDLVSGSVKDDDGGETAKDQGPQFSTPFADPTMDENIQKTEISDKTGQNKTEIESGDKIDKVESGDKIESDFESESQSSGYDTFADFDSDESEDFDSDDSEDSDDSDENAESFESSSEDSDSDDSESSEYSTDDSDDSSDSSDSSDSDDSDDSDSDDSDVDFSDESADNASTDKKGKTMEVPVDMLTHILTLQDRHRSGKSKKK